MANLEATSTDTGGTISYAITDGNPSGNLFAINANTGALRITRTLDYEFEQVTGGLTEFALTITATHTSGATNTATVMVLLSDINDHPPILDPLTLEDGLNRGIVGTNGNDADTTALTGTADTIEYIDGGAGDDAINGGGGDDHLWGGTAGADTITLPNRQGSTETIYYRFSSTNAGLRAEDGTVTVENFRYYEDKLVFVDTDASVITLDEFLADANVGTRDADENVLADGKLNLEVIMDRTALPVVTLTGIKIWINATESLTINFYEAIEVRGTDERWTKAGEPFFGKLINAAVGSYLGLYSPQLNDNTLLHAYVADLQIIDDADMPAGFTTDVFIPEARTNADGAFVMRPAVDLDATPLNNTVHYEIIAGNTDGVFSIDDTGGISVAAGKNLDFETTTSYTLTITATDSGTPTMQDMYTITIGIEDSNDIAPVIAVIGDDTIGDETIDGITEVAFAENNNAAEPELLTTLTFSIEDIDTNNDFEFRVMAGADAPTAAQEALAGKFEVALVEDVWTLKLKAGMTIDYETETGLDENDSILLNIIATDGANDSNTIPVVLTITDVNDTAPILTRSNQASTYMIDEQPTPADESVYAGVTLILSSQEAGIIPDLEPHHFSVQGDAGNRFEVVRGQFNTEWHVHLKANEILEYETETQITLRVTADDGVNDAYQTGDIIINVRDINNFAPVLVASPTSVEISESLTDADAAFATITATDADGTAPNNEVRYKIFSGNVGGVFTINEMTGALSVAAGKTLDYETTTKYNLAIHAYDGGTPSRLVAHNIAITVTDANDIVPTYTTAGTASLNATSGHATDFAIGYSITITDADSVNNFAVPVSGGGDRFEFQDQGNGVWALFLKKNQAIGAERIDLTYSVSDGKNTATDTGSVRFLVSAASSVGFAAGKGSQVKHIDENTKGLVATLEATSSDSSGSPSSIGYSIIRGNDANLFYINGDGTLHLRQELDYESDTTDKEYTLTITATETGGGLGTPSPNDTDIATVTVRINDVNEHKPVFGAVQTAAGVGAALIGTEDADTLTGTGADEYINGGAGGDTINSGRGDDHIWGGGGDRTIDEYTQAGVLIGKTWAVPGDETINLAAPRGSAETIYYRFSSSGDGLQATQDRTVIVNNFRYNEDNLILVDTDASTIDLDDFLSDARLGTTKTNDGKLYLEPIFVRIEGTVMSNLGGINIYISGTKALTLNFAEDSQPAFRGAERFSTESQPFLGTLEGTISGQYREYIYVRDVGPRLRDNTLLKAYVNDLQIIDALPDEFTSDVFIYADRTSIDGVFATLSTTDDDGTSPNNDVSYEITSGNLGDVFTIDDNGGISVAAGKSLNFDNISKYLLTITATDGGTPAQIATHTLRVAVGDVNDIVPTYTTSAPMGATLTFTGTDGDGNREDVSTGYSITITDRDTNNEFTFGLNDNRFEFRNQGNGVWELFLKSFQPVFYFTEQSVALTYYVDDGVNRAEELGSINFAIVDSPLRFSPEPIQWRILGGIVLENAGGAPLALGNLRATGGTGKALTYSIISVNGVAFNAAIHQFYLVDDVLWHKGDIYDYETAPTRTDADGQPFRGDVVVFGVNDAVSVIHSTPVRVELGNVDEGSAAYEFSVIPTAPFEETLRVTRTREDPDGIVAGSEIYSWTRTDADGNVVNIGTNSATYDTVPEDSGTIIRVTVSYIDAGSNLPTYDSFRFIDDAGRILNPVIAGTDGDDVINGAPRKTDINGNGGADLIIGLDHDENIRGGNGNDILYGGAGDDKINGGKGNDILYAGLGDDRLEGGNGSDIFHVPQSFFTSRNVALGGVDVRNGIDHPSWDPDAGPGANYYVIDVGHRRPGHHMEIPVFQDREGDRIVINLVDTHVNPYLAGNDGNHVDGRGKFPDGDFPERIPLRATESGGGDEPTGFKLHWTGGTPLYRAELSRGIEILSIVFLNNHTIRKDIRTIKIIVGVQMKLGSFDSDVLIGGAGTDNFYGFYGDDIIYGRGGHETIYGHQGDDIIHGGAGNDTLIGDAYEDSVGNPTGHTHDDLIYGGAGNDFIRGGRGIDHIFGGHGDDYLASGVGSRLNVTRDIPEELGGVIYGGDGIDFLRGIAAPGTPKVSAATNQYVSLATYYLDTRELEGNTDIIAEFRYNDVQHDESHRENHLRVHVTAEQKAILDTITNEAEWLARLQEFLNIRWDDSADAKPGTSLKTLIDNSDITGSREYIRYPLELLGAGEDTNTNDNVAFYHTRGTRTTDDDFLIMVIGELWINDQINGKVTKAIFDVHVPSPDFDPNGDLPAQYSLTVNPDATHLLVNTTRPDPDGVRVVNYEWYSITDSGVRRDLFDIADTSASNLDIRGHALPEGMNYGVTIAHTDGVGKKTTASLTIEAPVTGVIGSAATDTVQGGLATETIKGKGGNDHIWGGQSGDDTITLSTDEGDFETIYYRINSADGGFEATDGHETINNFRPGEDRLFLVDTDGATPISLDDFMSAANLGTAGGMVRIKPITDMVDKHTPTGLFRKHYLLTGVEIHLGGEKALTINYVEEIVLRLNIYWEDYAQHYVGFARDKIGPTGEAPLDAEEFLTDNTLFKNYFAAQDENGMLITDHNNLRILNELPDRFEDPSVRFGLTNFDEIEGTKTAGNALATVSATGIGDITYAITGGTDAALFNINNAGQISLKTDARWDANTQYEIEVTATDQGNGNTITNALTETITINVSPLPTLQTAPPITPDHDDPLADIVPLPDADPNG